MVRIIFLSLFLLNTISTYAQVPTSRVQLSVDSNGLQSLSYNGQNFIPSPSFYDQIVIGALFQAPDGTQKPYGWLANSLGGTNIGSAVKTSGTNPAFFQHIYRQGLADSFNVKMVWTTPDQRTAKADIYVTNNDATDTLSQITLEYFLGGNASAGNPSFFVTPDLAPYNSLFWMIGADSPAASPIAFMRGNSWGSVALFTDSYATHSQFGDVWTNNFINSGTTTPVQHLFALQNFSSPGGAGSNFKVDPILPGQTWHYTLYIRFGSSSDTEVTLAPEAFASYRTSFPYLVNWPDRRPIVRGFIANGVYGSALNPRAYFGDATLDVSNQANFNAKATAWADSVLSVMNAMNPKPQGFLLWDLEGNEFNHYFTYVGNPNKLHDIAPEMDAAADQLFAKFRNAGYQLGITLRPSDFQAGSSLPATCNSNADNTDVRDVFIKTDAAYSYRGYACTSPNTWTQPGAHNPWYQTCSHDDNVILNTLRSKVTYAKNRWGINMFYVDSTVYCGNGGGGPFNFTIFRQLQKEFPEAIFFPENEAIHWFGSSAPYNQTNPAVGGGVFDTPQTARNIYPEAFSTLANYDGVNFDDPATRNALIQSIRHRNIFMLDWWPNPTNEKVLSLYREVNGTALPRAPANPKISPTP